MFYINGMPFELVFVSPSNPKLQRSDGVFTLGCTDAREGCVYMSNVLQGSLFDKVLCHELVHCFCLAYGYWLDVETEELCADFLATYGREVFDVADDIIARLVGEKYG